MHTLEYAHISVVGKGVDFRIVVAEQPLCKVIVYMTKGTRCKAEKKLVRAEIDSPKKKLRCLYIECDI